MLAKETGLHMIKDHKPNFASNPKYRLINLEKSEIRQVSKRFIKTIDNGVRNTSDLTLWHNTNRVIKWFKANSNRCNTRFTQFDVVNFYPSISREPQLKTLNSTRTHTEINEDICIIMYARKKKPTFQYEVYPKSSFDMTTGLMTVQIYAT